LKSCVIHLARHGSKCDDWEAVIAERGNCYTGRDGTAGRLNLRLAGRLSVHPHYGIRLSHHGVQILRCVAARRRYCETTPGDSSVQQSGDDNSSVFHLQRCVIRNNLRAAHRDILRVIGDKQSWRNKYTTTAIRKAYSKYLQ